MNRTSIEWTDFSSNALKYTDASGRVVHGCIHASPGCLHCYSETLAHRFNRGGPFNVPTMVRLAPFLDEKELRAMLTYRTAAGKRVFVGDMTDIFGSWVPDEILDRLFAVFAVRGDVTWQVLTKRAERMRDYLTSRAKSAQHWKDAARALDYSLEFQGVSLVSFPLSNVWLGVSVEDQQRAEERIPLLLQTPAAIRFISAEPLLGPINLRRVWDDRGRPADILLDWVIVGGESGPKARPCDIAWIRSIVKQCQAAGVACFVKQLGAVPIQAESEWGSAEPWKLADAKGGNPDGWPVDLRVREFPKATEARG